MSTAGVSPVEQIWQKFLMDVELAKHFEDVALLGMALGVRSPTNPLLEVLLPSLLYVRLCVAKLIDVKSAIPEQLL
jgi:hypothetical protein